MSTLNLALQNVSLARSNMSQRAEAVLNFKKTLDEIREAIKLDSELGDAVKDSMATPLIQVGQRFQCIKIKDFPVKLGVPATESEIEAQFNWVLSIDPTLDKERLSKTDLQNAASLQSFMKAHCHLSAYAFQVNCSDNACYYCSKHQIQLSHEDFESLHFLSLPLLHPTNKDHYHPFSDVYGQLLSNLDQPSLKVTKQ